LLYKHHQSVTTTSQWGVNIRCVKVTQRELSIMVTSEKGLSVRMASSEQDIVNCQRLRYEVFAVEMGAQLPTGHLGLDKDGFDEVCSHLLVEDLSTGDVVACTRILTDKIAQEVGGYYYSDHEFDLTKIRQMSGRVMEIGRTCVSADFRNGATISVLWSGLASFMLEEGFDFLMGCASVDYSDGGVQVQAIRSYLADHDLLAANERCVSPRVSIPTLNLADKDVTIQWPPLLKAYMRLGAKVCGEPCLDAAFGVADFFILLDVKDLNPRYARHFLQRATPISMVMHSTMTAPSATAMAA